MRTARPPPLQNPERGPHGGLRVHRRLVQPPSPPFRPRLSFTDQLRKDSANRKSNRKPHTVHRNGVAPHIEQRIWRRIEVPDSYTLKQLHRIIQIVMGWQDSHLHEFSLNGKRYGEPNPEDEENVID